MKNIQNTDQNLLFDPSAALFHADLQSLWKQCASLTVLPGRGGKKREEEEEEVEEEARGESEQDREILRTERKRRHSSMKEVGLCEGTF